MVNHIKIKTGKSEPIVIEKKFPVSAELIWKALTVPKEMKKWYFDIPAFKAEPGFEFSFKGGTENREYIHLCKIIEVIEGQKLSYTWKYKGTEGETLLSFKLQQEGDETSIKLTHSGFETFPADNPDLHWNNFYEGWSYILGTSLKGYLQRAKR